MTTENAREFSSKYGPWALVAGGALGLGEAWCSELASRGLNIVSIDRNAEALAIQARDLAERFEVEVRTVDADLRDRDILEIAKEKTQDIDVGLLVYSAAAETDPEIVHPHLFHEGSLDFHRSLIDMNIRGVCDFVHHFGKPMMQRRRGGIVIISSGADGQGAPFVAHYGASKAYQTILGESLWFELKPYGVDAISVPLGMTRTTAMDEFPDVKAMEPDQAVREILQELGKRPQTIPGRANSFFQFILKRIVPKKKAIRMFADIHLNNFLKGNSDYDVYRK